MHLAFRYNNFGKMLVKPQMWIRIVPCVLVDLIQVPKLGEQRRLAERIARAL